MAGDPVDLKRDVVYEWSVAAPGGATIRLADIGVVRMMPQTIPAGRVWSSADENCMTMAGWLEKYPGRGEDAEPLVRLHASGRGILGVFDGTGGAGAAIARVTGTGTDVSGAYVASRLARDVVDAWFVHVVVEDDRAMETGGLAATLQNVLNEEAQYLPKNDVVIRGSMNRVLPTTAAALSFDAQTPDSPIEAFWAGDSRGFLLTPMNGMQVLTRDDTRLHDALELIRNDQPLENLIAAERPFRVNHRRFASDQPMVVLVATDGAFGYVRTPAHFEYIVLHALMAATTMAQWSSGLLSALAEFAADDVSYAVAAVGFEGFDDLKTRMQLRADYLRSEHWEPFVEFSGYQGDIEQLREESWAVYRDLYEERLLGPDAPLPDSARPGGQ